MLATPRWQALVDQSAAGVNAAGAHNPLALPTEAALAPLRVSRCDGRLAAEGNSLRRYAVEGCGDPESGERQKSAFERLTFRIRCDWPLEPLLPGDANMPVPFLAFCEVKCAKNAMAKRRLTKVSLPHNSVCAACDKACSDGWQIAKGMPAWATADGRPLFPQAFCQKVCASRWFLGLIEALPVEDSHLLANTPLYPNPSEMRSREVNVLTPSPTTPRSHRRTRSSI